MATSEVESDTDRKPLLTNGSFAYLLGQYGFEFKNKDGADQYYDTNISSVRQLKLAPFYVAMSGYASLGFAGTNALTATGVNGHFWSSTASNAVGATHIDMRFDAVWPSSIWGRNLAFSLCADHRIILYNIYHDKHFESREWKI